MKCLHHDDRDGKASAAFVLKHDHGRTNMKVPNKEDFIELDYIKPIPIDRIENNELVYIVDYSFKKESKHELDAILEKTKNVIWLDHHISSVRFLEEFPEYKDKFIDMIIDTTRCGAMITYQYFNKTKEAPYFLRLIDDYDRFVLSMDNSMHFKLFMDSIDHNPFSYIWDELIYGEIDILSSCYKGATIESYLNTKDSEDVRKYSYESIIAGHKCLVMNKPVFSSTIFGNKMDEYPICLVWNFRGDQYKYSIYTKRKDIDCSLIAEKFGGGGHPGAAGFSSDKLLFKRL